MPHVLGCQYKEYCIPGTLRKNNGGKRGRGLGCAPFFVHDYLVHDNFVHDTAKKLVHDNLVHDNFVHDTAKKLVHDTGALRYTEILSKKKPPNESGVFILLVRGYWVIPEGCQLCA